MKIKLLDNELLPHNDLCHYIDTDIKYWDREEQSPDIVVGIARYGFNELKNYKGSAKKVLLIVEPSIINGEIYRDAVLEHENFDYIFSHQLELKDQLPEGKFVFIPHGGTHIKQEDIKIHPKTGLVNFIFSDKQWNTGHRFRHEIYKNIKNLVDCYGSGVDGIRVPYKGDVLTSYAYSIAMENEKSSDYFTEKIIDCLLTGTIPIYYGTSNIGKYFNTDSIFSFNTEKELIEILDNISFEQYEKLKDSIEDNLHRAQNFMFLSKAVYNFFNSKSL